MKDAKSPKRLFRSWIISANESPHPAYSSDPSPANYYFFHASQLFKKASSNYAKAQNAFQVHRLNSGMNLPPPPDCLGPEVPAEGLETTSSASWGYRQHVPGYPQHVLGSGSRRYPQRFFVVESQLPDKPNFCSENEVHFPKKWNGDMGGGKGDCQ